MFFNTVWLYGAFALLVYGMAARQPSFTVLGTLLLLTAGISRLWSHWSLRRVSYSRKLNATRVFRDESIVLNLELINKKPLPLAWIEVEDEFPDRLEAVDRRANVASNPSQLILPYLTSLRPYERVRWQATIRCPHRGAFTIGPALLRSGDIFGFHRQELLVGLRETIIVYPRVLTMDELGLPPRGAFGDRRTRRAMILDPQRTIGTRDYRAEDSFRHIHWKATARAGNLQVRIFEPTTVTQLGIFLDLDTPHQTWRALDTGEFEAIVSAGASLATHAIDAGYAAGVYSNRLLAGSNQSLRVPPANGTAQLTKILEGLAKLAPFATTDFPRHLREATLAFPWGSTIVIVSTCMSPALAATLETIRGAGHRLVLITTPEVIAPPVRGLITHRLIKTLFSYERRSDHKSELDDPRIQALITIAQRDRG